MYVGFISPMHMEESKLFIFSHSKDQLAKKLRSEGFSWSSRENAFLRKEEQDYVAVFWIEENATLYGKRGDLKHITSFD